MPLKEKLNQTKLKMVITNFKIPVQHIIMIFPLIVCLDKMVENHQEEQNDSNDVAEHSKLNV